MDPLLLGGEANGLGCGDQGVVVHFGALEAARNLSLPVLWIVEAIHLGEQSHVDLLFGDVVVSQSVHGFVLGFEFGVVPRKQILVIALLGCFRSPEVYAALLDVSVDQNFNGILKL